MCPKIPIYLDREYKYQAFSRCPKVSYFYVKQNVAICMIRLLPLFDSCYQLSKFI